MTSYSQNGYLAGDRSVIVTMTVPGTNVRIPVRRGPCGDLLMWAAARWHREVEPLVEGTCWGYAFREIRGSSTELSNHASGTAIDLNAPKHPLGVPASKTYTTAQLAAIRQILNDAQGAIRWGGDYDQPAHGGVLNSRPDSMHLELVVPEPVVVQVLAHVQGDDDMSVWDRKETAWAGGVTDDKNTPYDAFMFLKRNNVEVHQCVLMLQKMAAHYADDRQDMLNAIGSLQSEVAALKSRLS